MLEQGLQLEIFYASRSLSTSSAPEAGHLLFALCLSMFARYQIRLVLLCVPDSLLDFGCFARPSNARWLARLARLHVEVASRLETQAICEALALAAVPRQVPEATVWQVFYRQETAFAFARTCCVAVHTFAFEEEGMTSGKRKYLVTTYTDFWQVCSRMPPLHRHFYEVIPEYSPCRLYFDLEYERQFNPQLCGQDDAIVDAVVAMTTEELLRVYGLTCQGHCVVDLESSNEDKFSRHLIFHLPGSAVFASNMDAGIFVRNIFSRLLRSQDRRCQLIQVLTDKGDVGGWLVDLGVYTRNRNFRVYQSTKLGKNRPLLLASHNKYHVEGKLPPDHLSVFLDTLVCPQGELEHMQILRAPGGECASGGIEWRAGSFDPPSTTRGEHMMDRQTSAPSCLQSGVATSPYPDIDAYIAAATSQTHALARIRRWNYFEEGKTLSYDITGNRFCHRIQRAHKSNGM